MPTHYARNRQQLLAEAEVIKKGGNMKEEAKRNKKCYTTDVGRWMSCRSWAD
jgi:hypothetical protein